MLNISPLRYPGGKSRLADFIGLTIKKLNMENCTYIEPFAGGAGVALSLLLDGTAEKIIINDLDKAIYSFWRSIKTEPYKLIKKIEETPITIEEWYRQKEIYNFSKCYSLELAFATLFLNRTNRSGILTGGPIGGYSQSGDWKLDVRFNKEALINRINYIAAKKNNIKVYNKDIISLINKYIYNFADNAFVYLDPPYYNKGQKLYKNFLTPDDHKKIFISISENIHIPWIITYDDVNEISNMYTNYPMKKFDLIYSAANKGKASELMIFSDEFLCPNEDELKKAKINFSLKDII